MLLVASPASACSVCFGANDPDASGLWWSALVLLVPVAIVQVVLVRFLLRAARREGPLDTPTRLRTDDREPGRVVP